MSNDTTKGNRRKGVTLAVLTRMKLQSRRLSYLLYLAALDGEPHEYDSGLSSALRVSQCSSVWAAMRCPSCGSLHAVTTWGCHNRLCPLCSLRASRATARQAQLTMSVLDTMKLRASYALLTLTQRNVSGVELSNELDRIIAAWSQLRYVRDIRRYIIGWARSIEITVAEDGSYHPHLHAILVLSPDAPPTMQTDAYWRSLWASRMGTDYIPICDCRPVRDVDAVFEVSKYVTKVGKLLDMPSDGRVYDAVCDISSAIYGRRLRSYGGMWARIRHDLAMRDADEMSDYDLATHDVAPDVCACGTPAPMYEPITLIWSGMDYRTLNDQTTQLQEE